MHETLRQPVWLNVGSSTAVLEGFANLDNSPFLWVADVAPWLAGILGPGRRDAINEFRHARRRAPLRRRDCRRPLPYGTAEVDHILCSHFLEYFAPPEMERILSDFSRVLRVGGTVHIILPDFLLMARTYVAGEIDADELQRRLSFHPELGESLLIRLLQVWNGFALTHRWMYDRATATQRMTGAGFRVLDGLDTPSSGFRWDDSDSIHLTGMKTSATAPGTAPRG